MQQELFWDAKETMRNLKISRSFLFEKTYEGVLPSVKLGRRRLWPDIRGIITRMKVGKEPPTLKTGHQN